MGAYPDSDYPAALDTDIPVLDATSQMDTTSHWRIHNAARSAILAIEAELGTDPSGAAATVAARFAALDSTVSGKSAKDTRVFDAVSYGALVDGSTDDTAAWQAAINAAAAAGGGVVTSSKNGVSIIAGALQDTSGANAQLTLPQVDYVDGEPISIVIRGLNPPPAVYSVIGATVTPDNHLVLKSTLAAGAGAVVGAVGPAGTFGSFTSVQLAMRDLTVRTVANPTNTGLDLRFVASVDLDRVIVDTGSYDIDGLAQPTTATSYGIRLPANNNGAQVRLGLVDVSGFYTGYEFAEHATGVGVTAWGCRVAAEFDATNHASVFLRFMAVHCTVGWKFAGVHAVDCWQYDVEHANTSQGWRQTTYDIDDASNYGLGFVRWWAVLAGTGSHNSFTVNGASGITTSRVGAALGAGGGGSTIYSHRDSLTALAGNTTVTLGATPVAGSPLVWVNGAIKWPGVDYAISGTVITLGTPLSAGDTVRVKYESTTSTYTAATLTTPGVNIVDNFNRTDSSTLGTTSTGVKTWTAQSGTWGILSNKATLTTGTGSIFNAYVDAAVANCTVAVTITPIAAGSGAVNRFYGLFLRTDGAGNGIMVQVNGEDNTVNIMRRTSGANTVIGTAVAYTPADGDVLSVVLSGSSITVKVNGVTKQTATDTTYQANTKHGLWQYDSTCARFDDFSIQP